MIDAREDQAAGLRRLFRKAPPTVTALFATGHHARASAAQAIRAIGHQAHRALVLDEVTGEGSLAEEWGHDGSTDLLHVLDERREVDALVMPVDGLMGRLPVAAAAMAMPLLDDDRRACLLGALRHLQRRTRFMLIHAAHERLDAPSPFVYAAPKRLVVVEASGRGVTEAYACLKSLAALGAGAVHVAVARARDRADAQAMFERLETLVRARVGIPLLWSGEVGRDDLAEALAREVGHQRAGDAEAAFLRRLQGWTHARFSGARV